MTTSPQTSSPGRFPPVPSGARAIAVAVPGEEQTSIRTGPVAGTTAPVSASAPLDGAAAGTAAPGSVRPPEAGSGAAFYSAGGAW